MRYYYIPLSSKNYTFENIFSTESISPERYYAERNFGFNYFYSIPGYSHNSALILFTQVPDLGQLKENGQDMIFFLAVAEQSFDQHSLLSVDSHILGYLRTIYLNRNNIKLLFFSERDKKLVQLRASSSLPTKTVEKYVEKFELITPDDTVQIVIDGIPKLNVSDINFQKNIAFDRQVNFFKGFVYGIIGGLINQPSPEQLILKRLTRQLINSIAEVRNKLDTQVLEGSKYQRPIAVKVSSVAILEKRLLEEMDLFDTQLLACFPNEILKESDFKELFVKLFEKDFETRSEAEAHFRSVVVNDKLFGNNQYARLKSYVLGNSNVDNAGVLAANIRNGLLSFLHSSKIGTEAAKQVRNDSYDTFKNGIAKFNRWLESGASEERKFQSISLSKIEYHSEKHQVSIASGFLSIQDHELSEFLLITNILLRNPKQNKSEVTKDQLLDVVRQVESVFSKGKETQLYKYLNNTINNYSIEKANSVVFKNFVAFVFNPDSLEKLTDFLEAKTVGQSWMAFAFWSTFNGFAQISQSFLRRVFETKNKELQSMIDEYLNQIFSFDKEITVLNSFSFPQLSKSIFYNEVIQGKFQIPVEDIEVVFENREAPEITEQLKKRYGINKKDGKKIAASYIDYKKSGSLF